MKLNTLDVMKDIVKNLIIVLCVGTGISLLITLLIIAWFNWGLAGVDLLSYGWLLCGVWTATFVFGLKWLVETFTK